MIADAIKQAQALAREAQEATYDGRCTVMEHQKLKDPKPELQQKKMWWYWKMNHAAYHIPGCQCSGSDGISSKDGTGHKAVFISGRAD